MTSLDPSAPTAKAIATATSANESLHCPVITPHQQQKRGDGDSHQRYPVVVPGVHNQAERQQQAPDLGGEGRQSRVLNMAETVLSS